MASNNSNNPMTVALSSLSEILDAQPELLALGEPTHFEPAFPHLRNRIFQLLAGHGFRSIALESDIIAGLKVDAYVRDEAGTLDQAMAEGFSHEFGRLDGNRELVAWMHEYNRGRTAEERLAFYGIDAPLETMSAPSPRLYLQHLHGYLTEHLGPDAFLHGHADLERLLGDDERWSDTAALMEAERSVGASMDAMALRAIADDLLTTLHVHAPTLVAASSPADWQHAEMHGRAALGVLRYHSQAAETGSSEQRWTRMCAVRDALIAENMLAIRARERRRGPTLVFANNVHLQRNLSTMQMSDMHLEWFSAGAIATTVSSDRYTFIAGSLGASATRGLDAPPADTYEYAMQQVTHESALFDANRLRDAVGALPARTDTHPEQGLFPLDTATLEACDAVLYAPSSTAPTRALDSSRPGPVSGG